MPNVTTCTPEMLLAGFAKLSPEDQERVRARLLEGVTPTPRGLCCDPAAMKEMQDRWREAMGTAGCETMAMCQRFLRPKAEKDGPSAGSGGGRRECARGPAEL